MAEEEELFAQVAPDDDDLVIIDSDKPGFHKWADALTSREIHKVPESCVGKWLSSERLVELTQQRGKKHSTIGFVRGGVKLLHPEEALYLLDEGTLFLMPLPNRTKAVPAHLALAPAPTALPLAPSSGAVDPPDASVAASSAASGDAPIVDAQAAPAAVASSEPAPAVAAAAGSSAAPGKRRRAVDPDADAYMPFQQAYELLMRNSDPRHSLTYSLLRSQGLVPLRHRKYATAAGDVDPGPQPPRRRLLLPVPHDEPLLEPVFDVYARDGISSFKPSAPGAPDFYVCIASSTEAPPTPSQIALMQWKLKQHSAAARRSQLVRIGDRADLAILAPPEPQVKVAIVAHSTVTFYAMTTAHLPSPV